MTLQEIESTLPPLPQVLYEDSNIKSDKKRKDLHEEPSVIIESEAFDPDLKSQKQQNKGKIPDGGYGWFVVLGCFISHVIIGSLERSDGIFFLQFQDRFGLSAQVTAWPGALVSTMRLAFGPVASIVCNRYSVRTACFIGSIMTFLGLFLNGYASSFYFLFLSHFLIQGIGRGLAYSPGLFVVGQYFDKRRGIATGIGTSGGGVGTFLLVPLIQLFFLTYGYQGAFAVTAAITLHLSVSAMLYRPLSLYFRFSERKVIRNNEELNVQKSLITENAKKASCPKDTSSWNADNNNGQMEVSSNLQNPDGCRYHNISEIKSSLRKKETCLKSSFKICFPVDTYNRAIGNSKKLFHFHLLRNTSFIFFCLSTILFTAAFKSAFTFIPAQVKSLGYSESEAAMVLSITGVLDTVGRILFGLIFDFKLFKSHRLLLYSILISSIATVPFILPSLEEYFAICIACGFFGMLTGGFISLKSVVLIDTVGPENSINSIGLLLCFQSTGTVIGPPVAGALRDATGSFNLPFHVGGALMLSSGCCMLFSFIFRRRQLRQKKVTKEVGNDIEP